MPAIPARPTRDDALAALSLLQGKTEEETEKRLGAAGMTGQPIICIDNLNGILGGDFLCQLVERPLVEIRVLGLSKNVLIENRHCLFATGNNIVLTGDITRRVVMCSLDPNLERPELRQFRGNPFATVLSDRGRYIAAAITIVSAYLIAGEPDLQPSLASFDDCRDWSARRSCGWVTPIPSRRWKRQGRRIQLAGHSMRL